MTILAGLWRFAGGGDAPDIRDAVAAMIGAQHVPAGGAAVIVAADGIALARADRTWASPARPAPRPLPPFVADARIDNRAEVLAALSLGDDRSLDDAGLLALAWDRWGEGLVDRVVGDFAFAAWDARRQALVLGRDPTGQRPLHYHVGPDRVAFASLPQGVLAADGVGRALDRDRLARFVAYAPVVGPDTFFRDVARVEPAQLVRIDPSGARAHRYWRMPTRELRFRDPADYVEGLREQLDRATAARLRGAGDLVAAQLSAGLDSGAVTATAARLLAPAGGRILAITSAPRPGFAGPVPAGRIADESGHAAALAALYPNLDHLVLRSDGRSPLDQLDADSRWFGQPVGYACNNVWWGAANAEAAARGATVMLTGEVGNLALSAGGLGVLADYIRRGRWGSWLREVRALERAGPRWRGLLAASFGPWIPRGLLARLRRFAAGGQETALATLLADPSQAPPPPAGAWRMSERALRWDMVLDGDPGCFRKGALLRWGIDERDPTADRGLIEYCFALPPEQLVGGGRTRRLARAALADRLPPETIDGPRGYQFADWYEALDRDALARFAERIAASPDAAAVIDLAAVRRMVDAWPTGDAPGWDWASARVISGYRVGLLRALSAGAFALNAPH